MDSSSEPLRNEKRISGTRLLLIALLLASLPAARSEAQAVVASGSQATSPNEFRSPMVLEAPFLLSDPARWNDAWISGKEYAELSRFSCERVFIESLKMRAQRDGETNVEVAVQTKLRNPNGNHDKRVWLTLELLNDGAPVQVLDWPRTAAEKKLEKEQARLFPATEFGGIDLEESDSATRTIRMVVLAEDLRPSTKLKITMSVRDESR